MFILMGKFACWLAGEHKTANSIIGWDETRHEGVAIVTRLHTCLRCDYEYMSTQTLPWVRKAA